MSTISPLSESEAPDSILKIYEQIKELLGTDVLPTPFLCYGRVESFLQDFYRNFKKFVWSERTLDSKTHAIIALATAHHSKNKTWQRFFEERSLSLGWTEEQIAETIAVVATCYTYNTFFKFRANAGTDSFDQMGVGLRANTFKNVSLKKETIELLNIIISNLNACQPCTAAHVEKGLKAGLNEKQILEAIQCAATIYSGCLFEASCH